MDTIRKQSGELEQQSLDELCDRVTGLHSSRKLHDDVEVALAAPGEKRLLMLLELDGLQSYNDRFGYEAGDELLRRTAQALVGAVAPLGGAAYRGEGQPPGGAGSGGRPPARRDPARGDGLPARRRQGPAGLQVLRRGRDSRRGG